MSINKDLKGHRVYLRGTVIAMIDELVSLDNEVKRELIAWIREMSDQRFMTFFKRIVQGSILKAAHEIKQEDNSSQ